MDNIIMENVTLDGLEHWLKHQYEHLGWVALTLESGHPEKAYAFANSLDRLEKAIGERRSIETHCKQTLRDFEVLQYKLDKLKILAEKLGITKELKSKICEQAGGSKGKKTIQIKK